MEIAAFFLLVFAVLGLFAIISSVTNRNRPSAFGRVARIARPGASAARVDELGCWRIDARSAALGKYP